MLWIRSDGYQIRIMVNNSSSLLAESECRTRTQWSRALALSGRLEEAMSIGLNDTSQTCRQEILNTLVSAFSAFRDIQETEEAEHTNRLITVAAETSLAEAKKSNNNDERYENLKELAVICKHTKVYQISEVAAENALAEVLKFSDTNERYEKLQEFAIVCKRAEFDKISKIAAVNALSHVTAISDLRQRCIELYKFTKVIAKANLIETAEVSAKQVFTLVIELSNSGVLQNSLQNNLKILTAGFTEAGLINIVLDEARKLTDPLLRCCMLTSAASALAKKGNRVEAQNVANEARELLSSFAKGTARSEAYAQVALTYVGEENNSCIDVYTALNLIPNLGKETQSYVRYLAVWELRDASNMKKAIEVTNEITNQYYRAFAYAALIPNIYEDEKDKNTRECIETSIDVTGVIVTDLIRKFIGDSSAALFYRASSNEKRDEEIAKKVRSALKSEVPLSRQFYDLVCSYANHEINPSKKYRLFKHLWSFVESLPEFGIDAGKRALAAARRIQDPEQRRTALMEVCRNFSRLDSVDQAVTVSFNEIDDLNFLYEISIKPLVDDSRVSGKPIGALSPRVNPKVIHRLEELYGNMAERFREDSPHKVTVYLALSRAFFSQANLVEQQRQEDLQLMWRVASIIRLL